MNHDLTTLLIQSSIIESSPIDDGFDALTSNGYSLMSRIYSIFFSSAEDLLPCDYIDQDITYPCDNFDDVYKGIRIYSTSLKTIDDKYYVLHDPTLQSLQFLTKNKKIYRGVLSVHSSYRDSFDKTVPLQTVKYHINTPTLHYMTHDDSVKKGRSIMEDFLFKFLNHFPIKFEFSQNHRDVSHYSDWSLSAYMQIEGKKIEVAACYQLSSKFSKGLNTDFVFFEVGISSRLISAFCQQIKRMNFGRLVLPSNLAPVLINVLNCRSNNIDKIEKILRDNDITYNSFYCDKGGTSIIRRAIALSKNGAPITLVHRPGDISILENIYFSRQKVERTVSVDHLVSAFRLADKHIYDRLIHSAVPVQANR